MKLLDGVQVSDYIKERHMRQAAAFTNVPKLVILHDSHTPAGAAYLRAKQSYGDDIGVEVVVLEVPTEDLEATIVDIGADETITGIIVQLPLADPAYTDKAIEAIPNSKDVDGLRAQTPFQSATPKGILWLLAAYNIELRHKKIAVVGQGSLVGKPLTEALASGGFDVDRIDINSEKLKSRLKTADIIISATGQPGLITSDMVLSGAIVIDAGSPLSELAQDVIDRTDITRSPNPGGVGPMTVAALFDNLLIAAGA